MVEKQQSSNILASKVCSRDKPKLSEVFRTPRVSVSSSNQFKFPKWPQAVLENSFKRLEWPEAHRKAKEERREMESWVFSDMFHFWAFFFLNQNMEAP